MQECEILKTRNGRSRGNANLSLPPFSLSLTIVNTASRMESTGLPSRIHISKKTANQLELDGKGHWITKRPDLTMVKGKGAVQTFFVEPRQGPASSLGSFNLSKKELKIVEKGFSERLVDWNVAMLEEMLKNLVAHRLSYKEKSLSTLKVNKTAGFRRHQHTTDEGSMVRDEVLDTIALPRYNNDLKTGKVIEPEHVQLKPTVLEQLRLFVTAIADCYRPNSFHSFEHASHVALSAKKLLARIAGRDESAELDAQAKREAHFQSYGIKSDPLTQFAIVFSALVHDVDHPGVSNGQLVQEGAAIAARYRNLSVAEQNSVDIAMTLLMDSSFSDLQDCIFPDETEYRRFRQVVINAVVTTDIFDKELKALREARWTHTYGEEVAASPSEQSEKQVIDRKATIVIELVIQVSDVSHTMQVRFRNSHARRNVPQKVPPPPALSPPFPHLFPCVSL